MKTSIRRWRAPLITEVPEEGGKEIVSFHEVKCCLRASHGEGKKTRIDGMGKEMDFTLGREGKSSY